MRTHATRVGLVAALLLASAAISMASAGSVPWALEETSPPTTGGANRPVALAGETPARESGPESARPREDAEQISPAKNAGGANSAAADESRAENSSNKGAGEERTLSKEAIGEAVRLARADLERGDAIFLHGKGPKRWTSAAQAFTAVIDRLAPIAGDLDADGRLVYARALDYRAQTSLGRGREKDADEDFAVLIAVDPSYSPDASSTPRKVLERFRRIQAARIAHVTIQADPKEAGITWNGRQAGPASSIPSEIPVLAGSFVLRARLDCFEETEVTDEIKPGERRIIPVHLDPTARDVRFESDPAGFDIDLDGTLVGRTAAAPSSIVSEPHPAGAAAETSSPVIGGAMAGEPSPVTAVGSPASNPVPAEPAQAGASSVKAGAKSAQAGAESAQAGAESVLAGAESEQAGTESPHGGREPGPGAGPGVLVLRCVPPGEHTYAARRDCYPEVSGSLSVDVDLLDRSPMLVPKIAPERRATSLSVETDTPGTELFIDGARVGALPIGDHVLCPGIKVVEVRAGKRLVWSNRVDLKDGAQRVWAPRRPRLRLSVAEGAGPGALSDGAAGRIRERVAALSGFNLSPPDRAAPDAGAPAAALQSAGTRAPGADSAFAARDSKAADAGSSPAAAAPERLDLGADLLITVDSQPSDHGSLVRFRLQASPAELAQTASCAEGDSACIDRFFAGLEAPWPRSAPRSGLGLSESSDGRGLIVLSAEGSARKAGLRGADRIVAVKGREVTTVPAFTAMMSDLLGDLGSTEVPIVRQRGAERVEMRLPIVRSPLIAPPAEAPIPAPRIAAVAQFEMSLLPAGEARSAALLNLASVLIGKGQAGQALRLALEQSDWPQDVQGAAASGTASFLAGLCHASIGEKGAAIEAFRRASEDPAATLWTPDGLPIAPLARIQLKALEER